MIKNVLTEVYNEDFSIPIYTFFNLGTLKSSNLMSKVSKIFKELIIE